jgi:hypothetical protein
VNLAGAERSSSSRPMKNVASARAGNLHEGSDRSKVYADREL